MKILHCLNHFLPEQTAGTEVYTLALCKGLQQQNITAEVAVPNYGKKETGHYEYDGIRVHRFAEPSIVDRDLQMGFTIAEGVTHFKKLVETLRPDIVHFHELAGSNGLALPHLESVKSTGVKIVVTFHLPNHSCKAKTLMYKGDVLCDGVINESRCSECMLSNQLPSPVLKPVLTSANILYRLGINLSHFNSRGATALSYPFLIRRLKNELIALEENCDKLVVLANWYRDILINNGIKEKNIALIKQGLTRGEPAREVPVKMRGAKNLKLIFVGRISHFKGVHLILDALSLLDEKGITVDVYGAGEDEYAEHCIERMNTMEQANFKGVLEPSLVVKTMQEYDVLVLPSTFSEMSPLVIQEAFAAGIPVLASNVYGNAEQIKDGVNGWLFKMNDSNDLMMK